MKVCNEQLAAVQHKLLENVELIFHAFIKLPLLDQTDSQLRELTTDECYENLSSIWKETQAQHKVLEDCVRKLNQSV